VKKRLAVLTMVDGLHGGGEAMAAEIALGLDRERFDVSYCVTRWHDDPSNRPARERFAEAGIEFVGLERSRRLELGEWRRLVRFMRERGIDVLHTHKIGSNFWGALLAPRARVPVFIAHEHTWSFEGEPLRRLLDRRLIARRADAFVAVSRRDLRKMIEVEHIPEGKLRLIQNGIPDPPPPSGRDVRSELGIGESVPLIGVVASLRPQKALEVFLESVAELCGAHPDLRALIIGGEDATQPEVKPRLLEVVRELDLEGTVVFTGARDDVADMYAAMDVGVLSSDYEGSPLTLMECMEAARPVVATAVGGVPDIVVDGETGFLVPPRDPHALAVAIERLLADPELRRRFGEAGKRRRRSEFSIANTVREVQALYEEQYARSHPTA
jgi:glycosyltransferase involved in cell wall biosynthesis